MLKRTITYEDFDGNTITEDFYFNLTKPEMLELDAAYKPDLAETFKKALAEENREALLNIFKDLILRSYGVRSADGKRFIKEPEITKEFTQTNAYATLYIELLQSDELASDFFIGISPSDIAEQMKKQDLRAEVAKELGIAPPKDESNATD